MSESDNITTVLRMSSHVEELLAEDPLATEAGAEHDTLADNPVLGDEDPDRCYTCHQKLSPAPPLVIHVQQTSSNKLTIQVRVTVCITVVTSIISGVPGLLHKAGL